MASDTTNQTRTIEHWIGGDTVAPAGRVAPVTNPATGQAIAQVAMAEPADVDHAVAVAREAAGPWGSLSLAKRAQVLFAFKLLLDEHRDELAGAIVAEHGKTTEDALGEVARGIEVVEFACGLPHLLKGEHSSGVSTRVDSHSLRQPLGVVAGITPFNFPVMVPMWMFPLAIACGNAFILKPSEKDPSASLLMAELFQRAGLPDGVLNVVQGDKVAVDALLDHPDIAAVSFVGSTPIARYVYERATRTGKRVQALGGAKNHAMVMPDADLDVAADAIASAAFGSAGERCMAISAVVAVGGIADELVGKIGERARAIVIGPGAAGCDMGPLVSSEHRARVAAHVDAAVEDGAELVVDGRGARVEGHEEGFFLGPTVFDRVRPEMRIYREEIFGPVLAVVREETYDDALRLINANPYGNGAAIFTADGRTARAFEVGVEAGMVGINVPIPVPMAYYSFGGWKDSLFGGRHVHGREGIDFYTRGKVVTTRWPDRTRGTEYGFPTNG